MNTISMKYDGRFGHNNENIGTFWRFSPEAVGEWWKFKFSNGLVAGVTRHSNWSYYAADLSLSFGTSYGFKQGLYEVWVEDEKGDEETIGWYDFEQVKAFLDEVKNRNNKGDM